MEQERLEREKELAKNLINAAKKEESKNEKRKRKKKKQQSEDMKQEEIKNSCDKKEDPNLVRVPPQGREDVDNSHKNNIKLQVKLSEAPLKSSSKTTAEVQRTVNIVRTETVKPGKVIVDTQQKTGKIVVEPRQTVKTGKVIVETQQNAKAGKVIIDSHPTVRTGKIIVEPIHTNGKVNLKDIKKPDILKSVPVSSRQVVDVSNPSANCGAKHVQEQIHQPKTAGKRKDLKNEKDIETSEKGIENGDLKQRKGKPVQNNNDIVLNKNIIQLNGNNNSKTSKKICTPSQPVKSSQPISPATLPPPSPKKTDTQKISAKGSNSPPQDQVCYCSSIHDICVAST